MPFACAVESFVPRQRMSASSGLRTHFFKQEHGDSRHNCHVAMEANTTRLDGGPRQHKNTVSTEDHVMSAHMRVDHQVGGGKQRRREGLAAPRLCHIACCFLCLVRMRFEQGRAVSRPTFALRLVLRCHDKHHAHTLVYLSPWSFCLTAVA